MKKKLLTGLFALLTVGMCNEVCAQTWDFTKGFSEETLAGLNYDYNYWGCWSYSSDTRYTLQCDKSTLSYYSSDGTQVTIKETDGLLFTGGNSGYIYIEHSLNRPSIKFNSTTPTVTIPGLVNGTEITIVTKTGNSSSERGITCTSGNATRVSGAEVSLDEITNVFVVTCEEGKTTDVTFKPYNGGVNIYSIVAEDITTIEKAMERLTVKRLSVDAVLAELDTLGLSGVLAELKLLYENTSVDETSIESVKAEIVRLDGILELVAEGRAAYDKLASLVIECDTLVTTKPWEELSKALATVKLLIANASTATVNDFAAAYTALKSARNVAIVRNQKWGDWSFNIEYSSYVTINGMQWYLDKTNKLAALRYCSATEIVIPETVTYNDEEYIVVAIYPYYNGDRAFHESLISVQLPKTLRYIKSYSFYYCSSLKSLSIPDNVYYIGEQAFYNCTALSECHLPESLLAVQRYTFYNCDNLSEIVVPTGVLSIEEYAFAYSEKLSDIQLPDSLKTMGNYIFRECYALDSLVIPAKVTSVGSNLFYNNSNLKYLRSEATAAPACSGSFNASNLRVIYVPVGSGASYRSASYWKNYIIVDGEGVSVTVNVETPGTLGEKILEQVEYLSDVNHLTVTGSLNSDDLYNIESRMPNLLTIDLSGTDMTALPAKTFYQRYALQKIVLPKGLNSIGNSAFYRCYDMLDVELPAALTSIGNSAFRDCDNIKNMIVPEGVTSVGEYAFAGCGRLNTVKLPSTLQTISGGMFYDSGIEHVVLPEGVIAIGNNAFYSCDYLKELICPSTLNSIDYNAFSACVSLSSISLNEGLKTLGNDVFYNCDALKEATLPSTLTTCDSPFAYCDNLKKVTCLALIPPYKVDGVDSPIYGVSMENRALYVPAWTLNKYKLTKGWEQFPIIEPLEGYWPKSITVSESISLVVPDTLPVEYKPNLTLTYNSKKSSYDYNWIYGTLSVEGDCTFSIGEYTMQYNTNGYYHYNKSYGASYGPYYTSLINNGIMRADSISIYMSLPNNRWAFVSFPFDVKVADIKAYYGETNYVIRKYSGKERADANFSNTWQDMTVDSVLHAGEGYIWQCNRSANNYCSFIIPAVNNANKNLIFANDTRVTELNEYQSEFSHNRSWNLIGNPFPCFYDTRAMEFTAPITVWDMNNNTYQAYSPVDDKYILRPGEAFFVQRPVDKESISFPVDGRQTNLVVKDRSSISGARSVSPRQVFNLYLNKDTLSDRTRFVINADAEMGYDMSRDASKFMSSDSRVPQLFTVEGDVHYAINERPMGNGVIALGAYFGSEGTYTLALDTEVQTEVILVDKLTGKEVNLAAADYTFSAEAGTVTDRFEIKFGGATSVEENLAQQVSVQAVGGQIIVNGAEGTEAVVYTADGKQITTVQGNAALDVNPGLYIVKVQGKSYKVSVVR